MTREDEQTMDSVGGSRRRQRRSEAPETASGGFTVSCHRPSTISSLRAMIRIIHRWLGTLLISSIAAVTAGSATAAVQPSRWVYPSASGNLLYAADADGVRINDFSD